MSEVKVNKISPRTACGTTTLGDSGDTFNVPCGSKINLASGGNLTVASGATITNNGTQTGFGREGTVDWQTAIQTSTPFTAATGKGYFINTTAGAITMNLPTSPSVGDIVAAKDYASTFDTNNLTIGRGGSNIGGDAEDSTVADEGVSVTLVYADATKGWLVVNSGLQSEAPGPLFVVATGGTPCSGAIVCTNYKVHTFTGPGTFCVSGAGNCAGSNSIDYLVVAAGGGGGVGPSSANYGGGGGGGGYRESNGTASGCYTVSPLATSPTTVPALPVSVTGYPVAVGGGGAGGGPPSAKGTAGADSVFTGSSTITSTGGGGGASNGFCGGVGQPGGSGGGTAGGVPGGGAIGTGNTPPTTPPQGNNGGVGAGTAPAGGGGGAICAGGAGIPTTGGSGGKGAVSSINATPTGRSGGGGGNGSPVDGSANPVGGGGDPGCNGAANTGGGGGGAYTGYASGTGADGVVIIRYKFQ